MQIQRKRQEQWLPLLLQARPEMLTGALLIYLTLIVNRLRVECISIEN
jgi:hypothetical protein